MNIAFPFILAFGCAIATFLASTPKGGRLAAVRRSFRRNPLVNLAAILLGLALLYAFTFGSHQLAAWLYGTASPDRDELRTARLILLSPIWLPFLVLLPWAIWHQRRDDRNMARRTLHAPKLAEPAKEYRVQARENER